jgi:hypothetical protein
MDSPNKITTLFIDIGGVILDDRQMFVEVAQTVGLKGIHHTGYESTVNLLAAYGLISG